MSNGTVIIVHLIAGLIKRLNVILSIAIPLHKNESISSKTV